MGAKRDGIRQNALEVSVVRDDEKLGLAARHDHHGYAADGIVDDHVSIGEVPIIEVAAQREGLRIGIRIREIIGTWVRFKIYASCRDSSTPMPGLNMAEPVNTVVGS